MRFNHSGHRQWFAPILALLLGTAACGGGGGGGSGFTPTPVIARHVEIVLVGLVFPASLAFLPDGRLLFGELPTGRIRIVREGILLDEPFAELEVPFDGSAEGLYGLAVSPNFLENRNVYAFHTHPTPRRNRVVRFSAKGNSGENPVTIIDNLPRGGHDGGRLVVSEDESMFISVGDIGEPSLSQDLNSLAGKILRVAADGSIPVDNPFERNAVFALGFRNVFGMALHPETKTLYVSDNGPECDDEVDRVSAGKNYGWRPDQPCGDSAASYEQPLIRIANPLGVTGIAFYQGLMFSEYTNNLLLSDYNTGTLRRYAIDDRRAVVLEEEILLAGDYGPLLDVTPGPDGSIYFSTPDAIYRVVRDPSPEAANPGP